MRDRLRGLRGARRLRRRPGLPRLAARVLLLVVESLFWSAIIVAKGKARLAVIGLLIAPVGWVAAIRLARPKSWWARRRYAPGSKKLTRATKRAQKVGRPPRSLARSHRRRTVDRPPPEIGVLRGPGMHTNDPGHGAEESLRPVTHRRLGTNLTNQTPARAR